jgi:DNA-directed RNA polymerase subunit RPC12/RpoP
MNKKAMSIANNKLLNPDMKEELLKKSMALSDFCGVGYFLDGSINESSNFEQRARFPDAIGNRQQWIADSNKFFIREDVKGHLGRLPIPMYVGFNTSLTQKNPATFLAELESGKNESGFADYLSESCNSILVTKYDWPDKLDIGRRTHAWNHSKQEQTDRTRRDTYTPDGGSIKVGTPTSYRHAIDIDALVGAYSDYEEAFLTDPNFVDYWDSNSSLRLSDLPIMSFVVLHNDGDTIFLYPIDSRLEEYHRPIIAVHREIVSQKRFLGDDKIRFGDVIQLGLEHNAIRRIWNPTNDTATIRRRIFDELLESILASFYFVHSHNGVYDFVKTTKNTDVPVRWRRIQYNAFNSMKWPLPSQYSKDDSISDYCYLQEWVKTHLEDANTPVAKRPQSAVMDWNIFDSLVVGSKHIMEATDFVTSDSSKIKEVNSGVFVPTWKDSRKWKTVDLATPERVAFSDSIRCSECNGRVIVKCRESNTKDTATCPFCQQEGLDISHLQKGADIQTEYHAWSY